MQRGRDRQRRHWPGQSIAIRLLQQETGLQHCPGQLLHEQWHAVGLGDDLVENCTWELLAARYHLDQSRTLASAQSAERMKRSVQLALPGRSERWPECYEHQNP